VSYSLAARAGSVRVTVDVPPRLRSAALRVRLRLPVGEQIRGAALGGRSYSRFDAETIDLTGLRGRVSLSVATG
jgi:hypothetical protein